MTGTIDDGMRFGTCFLLKELPTAELLLAFAASFDGRLNRLQVMEQSETGKTRTSAFRPEKVVAAMASEPPPWFVYLFPRGADRRPAYDLGLSPLQFHDGEPAYAVFAGVPGDEETLVADRWWRIAAEAGMLAGNGFLQPAPVDHLDYGTFYAGSPLGEKPPILQAWIDSTRRVRESRESFMAVVEGRMLRNVLRHNVMTTALADRVRATLGRAGLNVGVFVALPGERVIWTIEDTGEQQTAYAALCSEGLVWEAVWFDLGRRLDA